MEILKSEIRVDNLSLRSPVDPHASQWPRCTSALFLLYRTLIAVYFVAWFAAAFILMEEKIEQKDLLIYFTNWCFFFQTIYLLLSCFYAWTYAFRHNSVPNPPDGHHAEHGKPHEYDQAKSHDQQAKSCDVQLGEEATPEVVDRLMAEREGAQDITVKVTAPSSHGWRALDVYASVIWLFFSVLSNAAVAVALMYWFLIFPVIREYFWIPIPIDINFHLINAITMLIELFLCAYPVRLVHVVYTQLYAVIYLGFSVIYWAVDPQHHIIYPVISDWNKPLLPIISCLGVVFVVLPIIQVFLYGMYKLRTWIYAKVYD